MSRYQSSDLSRSVTSTEQTRLPSYSNGRVTVSVACWLMESSFRPIDLFLYLDYFRVKSVAALSSPLGGPGPCRTASHPGAVREPHARTRRGPRLAAAG